MESVSGQAGKKDTAGNGGALGALGCCDSHCSGFFSRAAATASSSILMSRQASIVMVQKMNGDWAAPNGGDT